MSEQELNTVTEPDQNDIKPSNAEADNTKEWQAEFFPVSEGKLITLYVLSFGLYGVYWFYKNWKLQQPRMDKKISPVLRSVFSILFTHSLFRIIDKSAEHLEKKHKFNANGLATLFVAAIVVSNIIDYVPPGAGGSVYITSNTVIITSIIIFLLSVWPLVKVQATVNRINDDILGYLNYKYSMWNYGVIALGVVTWILIAMGLLFESMGLGIEQ